MNPPGSSMFLGGPSIYIDDAAQRLQEQEEEEDQKRRNIELHRELEERFKQLDDDDSDDDYNHSINNSSRFENSTSLKQKTKAQKSHSEVPLGNLRDELSEGMRRKNTHYSKSSHVNDKINTPGGSLFLGGPSIYIDDAAQRLQEQEEEEDHKRRDIELHRELEERFKQLDNDDDDDGIYEDDDDYNHSINNSSRFANSISLKRRTKAQESHSEVPLGNLRDELSNEMRKKNVQGEPFRNYTRSNESPHVNDINQCNDHYTTSIEGYEEYIKKKMSNEFASDDQQLEILYKIRVHEVQRLSEELSKCRKDASKAHDELYARLAIANSEKERAQISLQQSQELVANSKHHITELERKVTNLSNKVETLQNQNDELTAEVSAATASLIDTQTRMQAEKIKNGNVQTDALFRAQQERYKEDTQRLEQDLFKTRNRLAEKENELLAFEKRFIDMERLKENLLVEKGIIINKLAMELEEAQNRISNNDNKDLKDKISRLTTERNTAQFQIKEFANKLEITANELVETRSKLLSAQKEMTVLESTVNEMLSERQSDSFSILRNSKTGQEFSSQSDNINLLRNEFAKTTRLLQLRKDEISKLKKSLKTQDEQIEFLKINEKKLNEELKLFKEKETLLLAEMDLMSDKSQFVNSNIDFSLVESLKTRCEDLEKQINMKTSELNSLRIESSQDEMKNRSNRTDKVTQNFFDKVEHSNPTGDVEKLSYQLHDAKTQVNEYKNLYFEVCVARDKLLKELEELKSTDLFKSLEEERSNFKELLDQLKNEKLKVDDLGNQLLNIKVEKFQKDLDNLKRNSPEKNESNYEIDELKKKTEQLIEENIKLKLSDEDRKKNFSLLINELEESRQLINQLNTEIELQGQREELISDLKEKAKKFDEFIEKKNKVVDIKNASTSPRPFEPQDNAFTNHVNLEMERLTMEKKIRQENAHLFNVELKAVKDDYSKKFIDIDKQFNEKLIQLGGNLKMKTEELETLKELILSERKEFKEHLEILKNQFDDESLHNECKKQILIYQNSVKELLSEIKKLKIENKSDLESQEIQSKFLETLQAMEKLQEKYKNAKKIAVKYKKYIVEKDKHYKSEIIRIENAYKDSLHKLNERLDFYINQKEQESRLKSSNSKLIKEKSALNELQNS